MRAFLALAALIAMTACTEVNTGAGTGGGETARDGYTVEVRTNGSQNIFLVTAPDGRTVGAHAEDGVSGLLDSQALGALPAAPQVEGESVVAVRVPGLNLRVSGDGGAGESGRVSLDVGGQSIEVDAVQGGKEGPERANVRIGGLAEAEVREFIVKNDTLSPAVQAEMLAALGLE